MLCLNGAVTRGDELTVAITVNGGTTAAGTLTCAMKLTVSNGVVVKGVTSPNGAATLGTLIGNKKSAKQLLPDFDKLIPFDAPNHDDSNDLFNDLVKLED